MAPEPVIGVDPPPEGAFRVIAAAALFRARFAFNRLLGRVAHLGEATEIGPGCAVARGAGRTMRPHVARPGHRSRDGQHARLRERKGTRAQRAHRGRVGLAQPRGAGHRHRRLADDRADAGLHRGGASAARRGHHRLRGDRAHAVRVAAPGRGGPAEPAQGPHLRALGHHGGRAARRQGSGPACRGVGLLSHRAADGGGHRGGTAHPRAGGEHGGRRRRGHGGDGGDLAGRRGGGARRCAAAASTSTRPSRTTCGPRTASPSASARPRR